MATPDKTVLIVEDDEDAADMFGEMMRVSGFRVLKSYSSLNALTIASDSRPDLVILDIMMPDVSGLDVLRQLRADPSLASIPVVIVSAKGLPADIKDGLDAGAAVYLTKPVGFAELKDAAERALRIASRADEGLSH